MKIISKVLLLGFCLSFTSLFAQKSTIGLISHTSQSYDSGYVLFAPMASKNTYLIDKCGKQVHSWASQYTAGLSAYILNDGSLLRAGTYDKHQSQFSAGGRGGIIQQINWNSNIMWQGVISDNSQCQHHDIYPLPNGNILAIVWEFMSREDAIKAGRDTSMLQQSLWSEKIVEIHPLLPDTYAIVWQWRAWDHLIQDRDPNLENYGVVADHPELININYSPYGKVDDWLHINGIDYNQETDQILISVHNWSEIWVIDHGLNTNDAAGHSGGMRNKGGDLLWRWGNPAAYERGDSTNQKLFQQHNAHWIRNGLPNAGKVLLFNNGLGRPEGAFSTVEILSPPVDNSGNYDQSIPYGPTRQDWIYQDPSSVTNFYESFISGADMLPNGNVLVCAGVHGYFFEVTPQNKTVWKYVQPVNDAGPAKQGTQPTNTMTFRATFYPYSYNAFQMNKPTQGKPIELSPINYTCNLNVKTGGNGGTGIETVFDSPKFRAYPNPANDHIAFNIADKAETAELYNMLGDKVLEQHYVNNLDISSLPQGIYVLNVRYKGTYYTQKVSILH